MQLPCPFVTSARLTASRPLGFFAYAWGEMSAMPADTESGMIKWFARCGFKTSPLTRLCDTVEALIAFHREIEMRRASLDYDIDERLRWPDFGDRIGTGKDDRFAPHALDRRRWDDIGPGGREGQAYVCSSERLADAAGNPVKVGIYADAPLLGELLLASFDVGEVAYTDDRCLRPAGARP
jgi:hypothetical protein